MYSTRTILQRRISSEELGDARTPHTQPRLFTQEGVTATGIRSGIFIFLKGCGTPNEFGDYIDSELAGDYID